MNDKFYALPPAKQEAIIQAGFQVFGHYPYKKAPMSAIADAVGISKSLLFHYFHNKRDLYLFLFDVGIERTADYLVQAGCYETRDLFELFKRASRAKVQLARRSPDLLQFSLKTYYEQDPEVAQALSDRLTQLKNQQLTILDMVDTSQFVPGLNLQLMFKDMTWAAQGYLWEQIQSSQVNPDLIEDEFNQLIDFWKSLYLRKE